MKNLLTFCAGVVSASLCFAGEPKLEKLWQSEAKLKVPESVLYDAQRKMLYVSNIDGKEPWGKDGSGSIGKVGLDGKIVNAEWVKGLHGPKGMGSNGDTLFVTDIDAVVSIDIEKGKILHRQTIAGAGKINDLSVAQDGTIYITDSEQGKIYKLINGKQSLVIDGIKSLNGVLHSQGELLFAADGALYVLEGKTPKKIGGGMEGHVDGIERIDADSWLVSCWQGTVYHVTRKGKVKLLLDGRPNEISAADLGYDPVNKIAYFPGFWKNFVAAYKLQ